MKLFLFQYYEMSYGLNVEMHKQTEICKRLDAIIRQVLPFLSGEVGPVFLRWSLITLLIKVTFIQIGHIHCLINPRSPLLTWNIVSASTTSGSCSGTRQADHHGGVERGDAGSSLSWFIKLNILSRSKDIETKWVRYLNQLKIGWSGENIQLNNLAAL